MCAVVLEVLSHLVSFSVLLFLSCLYMTDIHAFSPFLSLLLNPCDTCDFLNLGDFPAVNFGSD